MQLCGYDLAEIVPPKFLICSRIEKTLLSVGAFNYVTAEKAELYRSIMSAFADAKAHFVVHLRPEDIRERLGEVELDATQAALAQLVAWGNLQAEPDTTRVTSVEEFYRARYLYQITREGEAAERALSVFEQELARRGALQTVALEDIRTQLRALVELATRQDVDPARVHMSLRDLSRVFADLAENARAFMTGLGRTLDLRGNDRTIFIAYKERLVGYIERFIGDLVTTSAEISGLIELLDRPGEQGRPIDRLLAMVAEREAEDMAPELDLKRLTPRDSVRAASLSDWQQRWQGLKAWFVGTTAHPSQAALLRARARRAISRLLEAVMRLNERRIGRSDRSADFRTLARWFLECDTDGDAHRLWRAAFALTPPRHLSVDADSLERWASEPALSSRSWREAPPLNVSPRLRATGSYQKRGAPPKLQRRDREKAYLGRQLAEEAAEVHAARSRLATGRDLRLSDIGELDESTFRLFLSLLGEALAAADPAEQPIETITGDGSLSIEMVPLEASASARIVTPLGTFMGRDYRLRITDLDSVSS